MFMRGTVATLIHEGLSASLVAFGTLGLRMLGESAGIASLSLTFVDH